MGCSMNATSKTRFSCFVMIALSYGTIVTKARKPKETTKSHTNNSIKKLLIKHQRITFRIIITDFVCWLPFIMNCCCHYLDLLNATAWNSWFSILVLPINSIVNPLIHDTSLGHLIHLPYMYFAKGFNKGRTALRQIRIRMKRRSVIDNPATSKHENIKLQEIATTGPEQSMNEEDQEKQDLGNVGEQISCDKDYLWTLRRGLAVRLPFESNVQSELITWIYIILSFDHLILLLMIFYNRSFKGIFLLFVALPFDIN